MDNSKSSRDNIVSGFYNQELSKHCRRFEMVSLEKACLKTVIDYHKTFNAAFHSTKDRKLQRNLQFLRKKFSAQVLQGALERGGPLNESYLPFLVNEHLKEIKVSVLEVSFLSLCSEKAILKRMAEVGYGFEKVDIGLFYSEHDKLVPFINSFISHLPNVEELLLDSRCDDETIRVISSTCKNLKELHINGICTVSNDGIKHLKELSGTLKNLSLKYTNVEDDGITYLLENVQSLEVLFYHELPNVLHRMHRPHLINGSLGQVRKYNLTSLDLCHRLLEAVPNVSDILTICSELCPRLRELRTLILSEKHLEIVSLFPCLERLSIHGARRDPVDMNGFLKSSGKQLKELKMDCFAFSPGLLVENCPNLESLTIGMNTFQNKYECSNILPRMRFLCLDRLILKDPESEACFNAVLDSSPNLETLILKKCEIVLPRVIQKLSLFFPTSDLKFVSFRCTDVNFCLLKTLVTECVFLKTLVINYCPQIDPDGIKKLYECLWTKRKYVDFKYRDREDSNFFPF